MPSTTTRVNSIDGIRGWSLFGILLANLLIFQYGIFGKDEIAYFDLSSGNLFSYYFTKIFIEGAFMPIFTFIFGYSLILMKNSLERKQLRVKWHLFRRFIVLMVFGLLHSIFLWEGDILFLYGLMGIFLLLFVNRKPKTLLIWAVILFSIITAGSFFNSGEDFELTSAEKMATYLDETMTAYSTGTYGEIKDHRNNEDPMELDGGEAAFMLLLMPILLSPLFLFGMYAAHRKWLLDPLKEKRTYWIGILLFIPLGLFLKNAHYLGSLPDMAETGGIILSLGYISLFAFAYTKLHAHPLLTAFENVGKLSLTNYITQTVICTFIFYGYGLGLFGKLGATGGIILGIAIFSLQVVGSTLYLKYFNQGPLEKLMRVFVYLRISSSRGK
ncbi:DUF418 domain-containing protein [Sporosarcina limicola]|uniref:DUF418 domain-containing protein n=1 Tax=Sporosarcina limicola TaxID=34101 RepID=A0A927R314_9BACL|nr:DUF418 domain-containing protein [Sporosarcina limicola]MBE1553263.1 uncharacterized protein [Sporosarcina limicola]